MLSYQVGVFSLLYVLSYNPELFRLGRNAIINHLHFDYYKVETLTTFWEAGNSLHSNVAPPFKQKTQGLGARILEICIYIYCDFSSQQVKVN